MMPHPHQLLYTVALLQSLKMDSVTLGILNKPKAIFCIDWDTVAVQLSQSGQAHGNLLHVKVCVIEGKHN